MRSVTRHLPLAIVAGCAAKNSFAEVIGSEGKVFAQNPGVSVNDRRIDREGNRDLAFYDVGVLPRATANPSRLPVEPCFNFNRPVGVEVKVKLPACSFMGVRCLGAIPNTGQVVGKLGSMACERKECEGNANGKNSSHAALSGGRAGEL